MLAGRSNSGGKSCHTNSSGERGKGRTWCRGSRLAEGCVHTVKHEPEILGGGGGGREEEPALGKKGGGASGGEDICTCTGEKRRRRRWIRLKAAAPTDAVRGGGGAGVRGERPRCSLREEDEALAAQAWGIQSTS
uniref:Uncharacterized protein n=1 Tax=Oryza meridionalis TaxID=40149 RepID=A0A0E0EWX4_9ORYZ